MPPQDIGKMPITSLSNGRFAHKGLTPTISLYGPFKSSLIKTRKPSWGFLTAMSVAWRWLRLRYLRSHIFKKGSHWDWSIYNFGLIRRWIRSNGSTLVQNDQPTVVWPLDIYPLINLPVVNLWKVVCSKVKITRNFFFLSVISFFDTWHWQK